jgi:hypothetical protein
VDAVDAEYRARFGRKLTDAERAAVHEGASIRYGFGAQIHADTHDIGRADRRDVEFR